MSTLHVVRAVHARPWLRVCERALRRTILLPALATTASAQLISIKTVPLAQGDQFDIFPSYNSGMAGVSIALADTLADPFVNPAMGARVRGTRFFGSPTFYRVSSDAGGGRTLPLGAFVRSRSGFAGIALALQQVDASRRNNPFFAPDLLDVSVAPPEALSQRSRDNRFAFAMLGNVFPETGISLGASVLWAGLNMVDGVDLLYAGSQNIKQFGGMVDVRLGLLKEWKADRSLEAVLVHNRFGMTHDVTYLDWFWDPTQQRQAARPRVEHNPDRTNTWGLHVEYERPLTASGVRIGWLATANVLSHPKIPNYELMNIPRDPGRSHAYNLGVGLSRVNGPATFGIDLIYEPIWSHTWADAAAPVERRLGGTIPAGGKTIENDFRFSNAIARVGVTENIPLGGPAAASIQLGLAVRSIHYWLEQYDNVQSFGRSQEEGWLEWTPAWGMSVHFPELEIRYRGRLTSGTGRPGVAGGQGGGDPRVLQAADSRASILLAPSGPLTLDPVRVTTHQISLSLPLR
jgi:hypothetical protein